MDLNTPVSQITRVGKVVSSRLKRLDIETIRDLIFYYPFRWEDLSQFSRVANLSDGQVATVQVEITKIFNTKSFKTKRQLTQCEVVDSDGDALRVVWFNQPFLIKNLKEGDKILLSGKVKVDSYGVSMVSPVYEKNTGDNTHTGRIVPIYSLTANLTQKQIRFLIKTVIDLSNKIDDDLPEAIIDKYKFLSLGEALHQVHFPDSDKVLQKALARLKFEELFLFQLKVFLNKEDLHKSEADSVKFFEIETKQFVEELPFDLTNDQKKAAWKIISDLGDSKPMNRMLEGDVGSGKTLVATLAMLNVALNKKQSVLMAPTEILAQQHYETVYGLVKDKNIQVALLTRTSRKINGRDVSRVEIIKSVKNGEIGIIIGTHALIQDDVIFNNLVLSIIDEQHRFGVDQRKQLKEKSGNKKTTPHLLSMTATPIPRSLALTFYGDLDVSIIKEMPKERKKIITSVVDDRLRNQTYDFIKEQIKEGRQVFIVCPLIDPSDKMGFKSVTQEFDRLSKGVFKNFKLSLLHGKLSSEDKEKIMSEFLAKKSDILVSTSVIEVGVNVPNASVMIIEDADRFGLSQLHQFRGRVGRSSFQSYCFLFSDNKSPKTRNRLESLVNAQDGFELAELDLKFRGPGDIYGNMQSGWPSFRLASMADVELVTKAKEEAKKIVEDEGLDNYPLLKQKMNTYFDSIHFE